MKLEPEQLKKYTSYISELIERQVLDKSAPVLVCARCGLQSPLVMKDVSIMASPAGAGGDYDLCLECTIQSTEEANASMAEYYGSIM